MSSGFTRAIVLSALTASTALLGLIQGQKSGLAGPPAKPPVKKGGAVVAGASGWKEVERLVNEQKLEEASKTVAKIREAARARGDEAEWTKALIREVQLRTALHGYETSVRFLKDEPWPKGALYHAALDLFYAQSLVTYESAYGWEIGQREKVESRGAVDLKAWTRDQIFAEATRAYQEVWKEREALSTEPVTRLAEYIDVNSYPKGIRGTLRDAVSYLFVELLANTAAWRPEQSNELFRLDLPALIRGDAARSKGLALADPAVHPLLRIGAILDDLEAWHAAAGQREAALEARLERLRRLHASFTDKRDRAAIRADLEERLPAFRSVPWWAMGKAELADFVQQAPGRGNLVRARGLAEEGWKAYPSSPGGQRCLNIVRSIERPDYQLNSMSSDGPRRRSILVTHKNLPKLYFRAYRIDLQRRIETATNYNLLPQGEELRQLVKSRSAVAEWSADLPKTPDFKTHNTYITPPLTESGAYVIAASAKPGFEGEDNRLMAVHLIVGDLVLVSRTQADGALEVLALSGATGEPIRGATVNLYRYDWQRHHERVATATSDEAGVVSFDVTEERSRSSHFLLGKNGDDLALDSSYLSFHRPPVPFERLGSLVYTDRSIYRPTQKVFWKVVAFASARDQRGEADDARLAARRQLTLTVSLIDPNNQTVESRTVTTNDYGSAAGEFVVPTGRLLGNWRVASSVGGQAAVRVEEYKRPTFEASLKDPKEPLRLNRPATLTGEVRYYFGLPVVSGDVRWRVTRQPVWPWWWGWWWRAPVAEVQTIATGTSSLKEDGTFQLTFTPEADERGKKEGVTYRYQVAADVTDEGGETRSASRSFRLGTVAVEARIETETAFFRKDAPGRATILRTDLDGVPRAGKGTWRLVHLRPPNKALLPADQPIVRVGPLGEPEEEGDSGEFETPGDTLRPRWDTGYTPERTLRDWEDGGEAGKGVLSHDAKGEARLVLDNLSPGAYRLHYETHDDYGATYKASKEIVVAGARSLLTLPAVLMAESSSVRVGETARFFVHSGLPDQLLFLDIYRAGRLAERRRLRAMKDSSLVEIPVTEKERGGFGVTLSLLRDHQQIQLSQSIFVPWDDKELNVEFATFRDTLRPGAKETWRVTVKGKDGTAVAAGAAELLAYMYDRSLDLFAPHNPPSILALYPNRAGVGSAHASLGSSPGQWFGSNDFAAPPGFAMPQGDRLKFYDSYGIGGPGRRMYKGAMRGMAQPMAAPPPAPALAATVARDSAVPEQAKAKKAELKQEEAAGGKQAPAEAEAPPPPLRTNFSETAFWRPNLITDADGSASFEFSVPDSVTAWNVWVHAVTRDLRGGSVKRETRSVKDLMVRPYLPRFLREGDEADIKVVVNNASDRELSGKLVFDILDPDTSASLLSDFGLPAGGERPFTVKAGGGTNLSFRVTAPRRVGMVAFKVTAVSGDTSDGELRPLPLLPSRLHLAQSRFVTLRNKDRKTLRFEDLAKGGDPTLINEQMVVTVDAQLFYTVLQALPYLVNYPYECTEQTLNRFVSTGIVSKLYGDYPAIAKMAQEMSKRDVPLETWDAADPNRKMALEETPWLEVARGGKDAGYGLTNVLDPRVAKADREASLAKLRKAQTASGAFPWWPGGPPSPYMTLYIMHGFAKATEFGVDVPKDMVQRGWAYLATYFRSDLKLMMKEDCCWEFLTFLNYVASCYPDPSWTGDALTEAERKEILAFSFKHWKQHSPYLKGYLALTLKRMGRPADAHLVWDSVMDSAKTNEEQGTFWAAEDRSWLWYNDTIETQAFALRTLMELNPKDARRDGLVQWLLLNKKLNQWKSTRATAEVIYSLIHYLKAEGALGIREDATVTVGNQKVTFTFEPDTYTGKKNQIVIPGEKVDPKTMSTIVVEKESKGFAFASATWNFSTEKLPEEDRGDFFQVSRRYFKREHTGREWVLKPLLEGQSLRPGDQIEVQISLRSKHEAEYVHLRDPRAAGLEPENAVSRYKWDLGIGWYEETRDSGTNFFFERLPVGEYTFKYRLRVNMAGTFRIGPATVQSMYAPEFHAYSAGYLMKVEEAK